MSLPGLDAKLLHAKVLLHLRLADLGALLRTCKALHDAIRTCPDSVLLTTARHSHPSTHPLFSAASARTYLLDQSRIAAAISAGPSIWTVENTQALPSGGRAIVRSPCYTLAAARLADRLVVWELPTGREVASMAAPLSTARFRCIWTSSGAAVAFASNHGEVGILNLQTGEGSTGELMPHERAEQVCFLPGQQRLLVPGRWDLSWQVVEADTRGGLLCRTCPDSGQCKYVAQSALGGLAYASTRTDWSTLIVWHVGEASVRAQMPASISKIAWAPCGTLLACRVGGLLVIVSSRGDILARQMVSLPAALHSLVWGRLGLVLIFTHPHTLDSCELHWYSVSARPRVHLQHSLTLPAWLQVESAFVLSPDQGHLAFCASAENSSSHFAELPASPAGARELGSSFSPALGPSVGAQSYQYGRETKPVLHCLLNGTGIFTSTTGDAATRPPLVRFLLQ